MMQNKKTFFSVKRPHSYVKGQNSTASTTRQISNLLPDFLTSLGKVYGARPGIVLKMWPEVIGKEFAPMTEAVSFCEGILTVKVKNSTLYSLLSGPDKSRILKNLKEKCSGCEIKTIHFRLG
jgi:hypothetical protein